jgi:hypothetical protein
MHSQRGSARAGLAAIDRVEWGAAATKRSGMGLGSDPAQRQRREAPCGCPRPTDAPPMRNGPDASASGECGAQGWAQVA